MKISIIYPICSIQPQDELGLPHAFLLTSLNSIVKAGSCDFELLIGVDGNRPWVKSFLKYWLDQNISIADRVRIIDFPYTGTFGNNQRNHLMEIATGDYISFLDQDDAYVPNSLDVISEIAQRHYGHPLIFKMRIFQYNSKQPPLASPVILWRDDLLGQVIPSHVGGHMFVVPNRQDLLSKWPTDVYDADYFFIKDTLDRFICEDLQPVWSDFVITEIRPWAANFDCLIP